MTKEDQTFTKYFLITGVVVIIIVVIIVIVIRKRFSVTDFVDQRF